MNGQLGPGCLIFVAEIISRSMPPMNVPKLLRTLWTSLASLQFKHFIASVKMGSFQTFAATGANGCQGPFALSLIIEGNNV